MSYNGAYGGIKSAGQSPMGDSSQVRRAQHEFELYFDL